MHGTAVVAAVMEAINIIVQEGKNNRACIQLAEECAGLLQHLCKPDVNAALKSNSAMKEGLQV